MLRNARLITTLAAILFTLSLGLPAVAKTSYPNHIPNGGVNSCATCHVSPYGGGTRTAFGNDVRPTPSPPQNLFMIKLQSAVGKSAI